MKLSFSKHVAIWAIALFVTSQFMTSQNAAVAQERPVFRLGEIDDGVPLRDILKENFPNGNVYIEATSMSPQGPQAQILAREFGYITPANDFKQTKIHPEPGKWQWEKPDRWVEFAEQNNQVVRTHGPISPQCSRWAMADNRTAEELQQNLEEFMTALCKRYNGNENILWMDVVNETVNPDGSWKKAEPGTKWEMPWEKIGYEKTPAKFKHLGGKIPKYIIQAFRIANKHAPNIKLVINQHQGLQKPAWDKLKDTVLYLRSIGCRVDGVGWQAHIKLIRDEPSQWETGAVNLTQLSELVSWMHEHDLEFHVTENNLHVKPKDEGNVDEHAAIFSGILRTLLEKRHTGVVTWNLWDIKDVKHYANNNIKIGLWDRNLQPKKAYFEFQQLLENPPQIPSDIRADVDAGQPKAPSIENAKVIGNQDFIHLQNDNGVWWLTDHTGKRFITTGMNHVGEGGVLFNEVNKGWLTGKFGEDIKGSWGGLNPRAKNHGGYADMVVKDFKDYSFNTIPFHAYSTPLELYEERKIYYLAKIKVQSISLMGMNRAKGARFPDVFSESFRGKLDALAKKTCTPLRDAKYCLGYAYFDMPDLKPARRWHKRMFPDGGLVYPWVQDLRELTADAAGKQEWIRILKQNHASAAEAAQVYAVKDATSWEDLAKLTSWPIEPNDVARVKKDADDMLTSLAENWYGLHKELIRKYDPNHLLLGDKHDVGYDTSVDMIPDGVLDAIGKHCDVLTIQYYTFYTDQHNADVAGTAYQDRASDRQWRPLLFVQDSQAHQNQGTESR